MIMYGDVENLGSIRRLLMGVVGGRFSRLRAHSVIEECFLI